MTFGGELHSVHYEIFAWSTDISNIFWNSMDVFHPKTGMVPGVLTVLNGKIRW